MSYEEFQHNPSDWVRTNGLWGRGQEGMEHLFQSAPTAGPPFPHSARSSNRRAYFNHGAIEHAMQERELTEVDPRTLMKSQSHILHAGVQHYMGDQYEKTGETYASPEGGNRFPVVYEAHHPQFGNIQRTILGGHHRATSALLRGVPLRAVLVRSPYLK